VASGDFRKPVLVANSAYGLDALITITSHPKFSAQVADMHIYAAIISHRFTTQCGKVQVLLLYHFATAL